MVEVVMGDIVESKAQTLVNTVNTVGVMGKGIALQFRKRFPDMHEDYVRRCKAGQVKLGQPYLYRSLITPWILNFPTKDHWRSIARLEDIAQGTRYLIGHYKEWGITSLAVPPLGCGEGQLEWHVVGPTLYRYLSKLDIPVELYAPYGTPDAETQSSFLSQPTEPVIADAGVRPLKIKPDWVAIVEILARIEAEPYHWPVGRVMFQKIAYFATEAGLSTDLVYSQASFGPYASSLKFKITQLVNNGLIREERLGRMFHVMVGPTFKDARKAYQKGIMEREKAIDQVVNLFLRIMTPQAEMAATVHFAARSLTERTGERPSENGVLRYVMDWKQRRRPPIDEPDVAKTIRNLAVLGWLKVKPSKDLPLPDEAALEV